MRSAGCTPLAASPILPRWRAPLGCWRRMAPASSPARRCTSTAVSAHACMIPSEMVRFAHRLWSSPTLTTWGSLMLRTGGVLVTTPLLLNRFSTAEIAVWYFFATVTSLQIVFEMGFTPSFSRAVAYALGGAEHVGAAGTSRIRPVVTSG